MGSLTQLVIGSDVMLSVLVPAKQVTEVISNVGKEILYVDCNAIAPYEKLLMLFPTKLHQTKTCNSI